jgi:Zn-dependent peptidase ImmA (M78 family)
VQHSPDVAARARMLVLARESRGMTQAEVAEAITAQLGGGESTTQGYVSKAEAGRIAVYGERLGAYAAALGYRPGLLAADDEMLGAGVGLVHHRRRASLGATALRRIHAVLNLTRIQLHALLDAAGERPPARFPEFEIDDFDTAEDAAQALRKEWRLPAGPVESVVGAIEGAGGLVARRHLAGRELDAVSQHPEGENPVFLLNCGAPGDRQRYTVSHELGHVVMHRVLAAGQERQADEFASEFLMPAGDIRTSLKGGLSLERLIALKKTWRVSIAALIRRAHTLGALSAWQYRQLNVELSTLGYRTQEPASFAAEQPRLTPALIDRLRRDRGFSVADLAALAGLSEEEFRNLYIDQTDTHV